ncbi:MAG: glucose-1-phosphate adenylyltransferase, partial [Gammaproteobacteria bacterium]|nr:glucose-1-phosphate adenylyltransferase [Gammaproteobacteria bacterium]
RTVAALPFGGSYRVVDFPLTNFLHSGLRRIFVFTQFNSLSLQNHLRDGWSIFNTDLGEFVMPVTPPMRDKALTYGGPADALLHNLYLLERSGEDTVIVVSGEQLYRMDYAAVLTFHAENDADMTVVGVDPELANGAEFDCALDVNGENRVTGVNRPGGGGTGPMGIYVFNRELLINLVRELETTGIDDAGIDALVEAALGGGHRVSLYRFGGEYGRVSQDRYWRTLSSLDSYYEANMDLLRLEPLLDLYQTDWPIRSYQIQCPPARTVPGESGNQGVCVNSIVSGGTVIAGGGVNHSVLSYRVQIGDGATVEESILFSGVSVGAGASLQRVICDRGVNIPAGETIGFDPEADARRFTVTANGIVVISSNADFG